MVKVPDSELMPSIDALNFGSALLNPVVIQLIIAIATVAAIIVGYYSAKAATKLTFEISERREHSRTLVDKPLGSVRPQVLGPESAIIVWFNYVGRATTLTVVSSNFKDRTEEDPNKKFLISHLESGYPEIYEALGRLDSDFNSVSSDALGLYQQELERLRGLLAQENMSDIQFDYIGFIANMSTDLAGQKKGSDPQQIIAQMVGGDSYNIRYGSQAIADRVSQSNTQIVGLLDTFRRRTELTHPWEQLYERALGVFEKAKKLEQELSMIQAYVRAGNFIKGSCPAGIDAGYEKSGG